MKNSQMFKKPATLCLLFLYYPHLEDSKTVLIICQQKMPLFNKGSSLPYLKPANTLNVIIPLPVSYFNLMSEQLANYK